MLWVESTDDLELNHDDYLNVGSFLKKITVVSHGHLPWRSGVIWRYTLRDLTEEEKKSLEEELL